MKIKSKKYFYFILTFIIFLGSPVSTWSMDRPEEYKIPSKTLSNGNPWEKDVSNQGNSGTCCSHAVSECLKYVHGRDRILPFYLHKTAHFHYGTIDEGGDHAYKHYNKGHSVMNLMEFARDYGVPEIPLGQTFQKDSNLSFPSGTTKYAFKSIYSVYDNEWGNTKIGKIKNALIKYQHPIVIDVISTLNGQKLFTENTRKLPSHLERGGGSEPEVVTIPISLAHAVTAYGYSDIENGLLIKNSWGTSYLSEGRAVLSYDYLNEHSNGAAYIGFGTKYINDDYAHPFGYGSGICCLF